MKLINLGMWQINLFTYISSTKQYDTEEVWKYFVKRQPSVKDKNKITKPMTELGLSNGH